jgi:hypothetical protein
MEVPPQNATITETWAGTVQVAHVLQLCVVSACTNSKRWLQCVCRSEPSEASLPEEHVVVVCMNKRIHDESEIPEPACPCNNHHPVPSEIPWCHSGTCESQREPIAAQWLACAVAAAAHTSVALEYSTSLHSETISYFGHLPACALTL